MGIGISSVVRVNSIAICFKNFYTLIHFAQFYLKKLIALSVVAKLDVNVGQLV